MAELTTAFDQAFEAFAPHACHVDGDSSGVLDDELAIIDNPSLKLAHSLIGFDAKATATRVAEDADMNDMDESYGKPKVNVAKSSYMPSKGEIEEHKAAFHIPYISWCRHCTKGKAKNESHMCTKQENEEGVPSISMN